MSIGEIYNTLDGYFKKLQGEWERARFIGACFVGGKPQDIIKFPWEEKVKGFAKVIKWQDQHNTKS